MGKSLLIINTPEKCSDCILPTICQDGKTVYCKGFPEVIKEKSKKPEWCPLVPIPEKMEICGKYPQPDGIVPSYKIGWNKCIDAIVGQRSEDENSSALSGE